METRRSLLWSAGALTIVALLAATIASAAVPTSCSTTNFGVNVAMTTTNGITRYEYHMSSPTGKNANKFFTYVYRGLQGDLQGTISGSPSGTYEPNGTTAAANCPPSTVWSTNKDNDGYCFTSVAVGNVPVLTVSERYQPEEGATTVILGINNSYESCGPILGPTTPASPEFEGSRVASRIVSTVMEDGCIYDLTAGTTDNIVTQVAVNPATPFSSDGLSCVVYNDPDPQACAHQNNLDFCPPTEVGRPPLVGNSNGTAGASIAVTCPPSTDPTKTKHVITWWTSTYSTHSCVKP